MSSRKNNTQAAKFRRGAIGVIPTDTIYGIVGSALSPKTVKRIYRLRKRNPKKPMIILIGRMGDLRRFGLRPSPQTRKRLRALWPGKVSVILPCAAPKFAYLHRGTRALAFRLPRKPSLRRLLQASGPLVAPSANPEGKTPARTIGEAKAYFGDRVDFYIDEGRLSGKPSKLVALDPSGELQILRK